MGIFALRTRPGPPVPGTVRELSPELRMLMPPRFEVVAECLTSGEGSVQACQVVGEELARDGASLQEALAGLRETSQLVGGVDPAYDDVSALLVAWSDATLAYLHQVSCEEPMTGLASPAHLRSRLAELYRGQLREAASTHLGDRCCLVVLDLPHDRHGAAVATPASRVASTGQSITRSLRMARLGEAARTVFNGSETIGRISPNRVVVVADRDERLGKRVRLLRRLVEGVELDGHASRIWIEGLPATDAGATMLLDELARP